MQVDIDILVYAVVAALLLGRLWSVLGTRNENDPQRPNPFTPPPEIPPDSEPSPLAKRKDTISRLQALAPPPRSLAGGLAQVKAADPSFDEKQFLRESRDIFTSIVGAYASGHLALVTDFLSPTLLEHFQQAVDARTAAGQTAQTRIARIKEAEVTAARVEGAQAFVTTRFVSDQENTLRDASGAILGGAEGKVEEVTDLWTFARETNLPVGAKWVVVETKG